MTVHLVWLLTHKLGEASVGHVRGYEAEILSEVIQIVYPQERQHVGMFQLRPKHSFACVTSQILELSRVRVDISDGH